MLDIDDKALAEYVPGFEAKLGDLFLHEKFRDKKSDVFTCRVLRWILLCYDASSKLVRSYENVEERKEFAMKLCGGLSNKKKAESLYLSVVRGEDSVARDYVTYFLTKVQANKQFEALISLEAMFLEYNAILRKEVTGLDDKKQVDAIEKKEKIRQSLSSTAADIEGLKKEIFLDYYEEMDIGMQEVERRLRPETIDL